MSADTVLDRAARAAHAAMEPDGRDWDRLTAEERDSVRRAVTAAVTALREPDQHMAVQGLVELGRVAEEQGQRLTSAFTEPETRVRHLATGLTPHDATRVWRAMADAVLAAGTGGS